MTTHLLAVRLLGRDVGLLPACLLAAGLLALGLALWWKADRPLLGVPLVAAAAWLGYVLFHAIV